MLAVAPLQNEHRENPKRTLGTAVYGRQATSVGLRGCRTGSIRRTKGHHFWTMVKGSKVITFLFQAALPSPSEFPACMQEATETITPTTIPYTVCLRVNNGFMDCCILALCKCCSDASLFFPNFRWNSFGTLRLQSFLSNQQSALTPIIRLQSNTVAPIQPSSLWYRNHRSSNCSLWIAEQQEGNNPIVRTLKSLLDSHHKSPSQLWSFALQEFTVWLSKSTSWWLFF